MALIDFAILTALPEELEYLKSVLPPTEELTESYTWYRTRVHSTDGTNYELVLACQNKMGSLEALDLTKTVLGRWDPSHIILVGIAGSFHEKVKLGDVIVSQQIFYFDQGRATDAGLQYRPEGYPCGLSLIRQIHAISVEAKEVGAWRKAALKSATAEIALLKKKGAGDLSALKDRAPSIHVGTVASGSLVITSKKKKEELLRLHGKLLGVEMEGAGVMHAAFFNGESPASAIVIKGISDGADSNKALLDTGGFWRKLAGENAARLALAIIKRGRLQANLTDQFEIDVTMAAAHDVRSVIKSPSVAEVGFPGFTQLIVPKGPLTRLSIRANAMLNGKPVQVLEARLIYYVEGERTERELHPGEVVQFETKSPVDTRPIGLYMLAQQEVDQVDFEISSGSSVKTKICRV
jgi:nucleoside phosphorylase